MRRLLPDSLVAWALLILICGLVIAEVATLASIIQARTVNGRMNGFFHLAERVSSMSRAIAAEPVAARDQLAAALSSPTLSVSLAPSPQAAGTLASDDEIADLEDVLLARLSDSGVTDVRVERSASVENPTGSKSAVDDDAGPVERFLSEVEEDSSLDDGYNASVQLADGSWINFGIPIVPSPGLWSANTVMLTAAIIALVLASSIWALRMLTAPYAMLAAAAERLGRDINSSALPEKGTREVRAAAHAFNLMQERLKRSFSDRDQLVAAISHDLRTPVTRLRLRADFIDDSEQRARMLADLDDIETMTRSVLAFASDAAQPEPRETIDLVSLLESLCDDEPGVTLDLGQGLPTRVAYSAQPVGLRRCIANLINNAVKYGSCARVSLSSEPAMIRIVVDDDGPGIAERDAEAVFRPFHRLENSRNRETGGTGLGLTIARSVARAHGGDVILSNRPGGGLRAMVTLPLAPKTTLAAATLAPGPAPAPTLSRVPQVETDRRRLAS